MNIFFKPTAFYPLCNFVSNSFTLTMFYCIGTIKFVFNTNVCVHNGFIYMQISTGYTTIYIAFSIFFLIMYLFQMYNKINPTWDVLTTDATFNQRFAGHTSHTFLPILLVLFPFVVNPDQTVPNVVKSGAIR